MSEKIKNSYRMIVAILGIPTTQYDWAVALGTVASVLPVRDIRPVFHGLSAEYNLPFTPSEVDSMAADCLEAVITRTA